MFVKSAVVGLLIFTFVALSYGNVGTYTCKILLTNETLLEQVLECNKGLPSRIFIAAEECRIKVAKGRSYEDIVKLQCTEPLFTLEYAECQNAYLTMHGGAMTDAESRVMLQYQLCQLKAILQATENDANNIVEEIEIVEKHEIPQDLKQI